MFTLAPPFWQAVGAFPGTVQLSVHGNTDLTDSSAFAHTIVNGYGTAVSASIYKYGGGSVDCTASSSTRLITNQLAELSPGSGPSQVECWFNPTAYAVSGNIVYLFSAWHTGATSSPLYCYCQSGNIVFGYGVSGPSGSFPITLNAGTWRHIAIVFDGANGHFYLDGVLLGSALKGAMIMPTELIWNIGGYDTAINTWCCQSYIDDFRLITDGYRYTGAFTPPTSQLSDT